jgi:hypothetical protein
MGSKGGGACCGLLRSTLCIIFSVVTLKVEFDLEQMRIENAHLLYFSY